WFGPPTDDVGWRASVARTPVTMNILGILRRDPYVNLDNTFLEDPEVAVDELRLFADSGGGCVVEMSFERLGGNRAALPEASRASGVHIIAGAGLYREDSLPDEILGRSVDE